MVGDGVAGANRQPSASSCFCSAPHAARGPTVDSTDVHDAGITYIEGNVKVRFGRSRLLHPAGEDEALGVSFRSFVFFSTDGYFTRGRGPAEAKEIFFCMQLLATHLLNPGGFSLIATLAISPGQVAATARCIIAASGRDQKSPGELAQGEYPRTRVVCYLSFVILKTRSSPRGGTASIIRPQTF